MSGVSWFSIKAIRSFIASLIFFIRLIFNTSITPFSVNALISWSIARCSLRSRSSSVRRSASVGSLAGLSSGWNGGVSLMREALARQPSLRNKRRTADTVCSNPSCLFVFWAADMKFPPFLPKYGTLISFYAKHYMLYER